jgi:hypothetical protein
MFKFNHINSILTALYTTGQWQEDGGYYASLGDNGELAVGKTGEGKFGPVMWNEAPVFDVVHNLVRVVYEDEPRIVLLVN